MNKTGATDFQIGTIRPISGMEGECLIAQGLRIAAISASQIRWWEGSLLQKRPLPNIVVGRPCWSDNGIRIYAGTGFYDLDEKKWTDHPALGALYRSPHPDRGGLLLKTTSWSRDGRFVAALLDWVGPSPQAEVVPEILLYDITEPASFKSFAVAQAVDVVILGAYMVVLAPSVGVWDLAGNELARFPETAAAAQNVKLGPMGNYLHVLDDTGSIQIIETATWQKIAAWPGPFHDMMAIGHALIAISMTGRFSAACLQDDKLEMLKTTIPSDLRTPELISYQNQTLIIRAIGEASAYAVDISLNCPE